MKKTTGILSLILVLGLMVGMVTAFGIMASAAAEDISVIIDTGAEITLKDTDGDDYYEISTADELFAFAAAVNGGNESIGAELTSNVDVNPGYVFNNDGSVTYNGVAVTEGWRTWIPIAYNNGSYFRGNFNGNYYTVSGLYTHTITDTDHPNVSTSFFGAVRDAVVIENVGVDNSYFRCDVTEGKSGHSCNASGLVCYATAQYGIPTIRNCWSMATVYAYSNAGGILESISRYVSMEVGAKIDNCFFGGYIAGRNNNYGLGNTSGAVCSGTYQISNTYYDKTKMGGNQKQDGGAIPATTEQFANGYVAYQMGGVFGQNIDNGNTPDLIPVFGGPRVYRNGICSSPTYSNTEGIFYHDETLIAEKYYDENDCCLVCGGFRVVKIDSLTVGDVEVVVDGVAKTTSGTGWTYNHETRTLTFEDGTTPPQFAPDYMVKVVGDLNISVNGTVSLEGNDAVIYSEGRVVIELNNDAILNLTAKGRTLGSVAINSTNDIILKGSGTVNTTGSQNSSSSMSVNTDADIIIDGVTWNALGKGNYDDIMAKSLIIGKTAPATVNCLGTTNYAMSLEGNLELYNGSTLIVGDKSIDSTASIISADGNVIVSDSTLKIGSQKAFSWINIIRADTVTVSGKSHIIVDSIACNNITVVEGTFNVDGNYYLKSNKTSGYVYNARITNDDVTNFELVMADHLKYTYNNNGTHKCECDECTYAVAVEDDIPCSWIYSANGNELTAICSGCGATDALTINAPTNLTYDGTSKGATINGEIPNVATLTVEYRQGSSACSTPINAGTYIASITLGSATVSVEYTIEKAIPNASHFAVNVTGDITYSGEVTMATVSAASGVYGMGEFTTVVYKDGAVATEIKDVGEYKIAIKLLEGENYKDSDEITIKTFTVAPCQLNQTHVDFVGQSSVVYNGENQKPGVSVAVDGELVINEDYTFSWDKDSFVSAGEYVVTIQGIGNYSGIVNKTFRINPKDLSNSDITIDITEVDYDGEAHIPTINVTDGEKQLVIDVDYTLDWDKDSFVNAGTYTATIEGIGNYSGSFTRQLVIAKIDPQIDVSSPISSILPGNSIFLTVTSVSSELPTPVITGTNFTYDGLKITANDGLVIGLDTVEITVSYAETTNYLSGSDTITLKIGMVDFSGDIEKLKGNLSVAVEDLNAKIESGNSNLSAEIGAVSDALAAAKSALEAADGQIKTDLEKVIADGDDALEIAINKVAEDLAAAEERLEAKIATGNSNLSAEIGAVSDALAAAKSALEKTDTANKEELVAKIDTADATLDKAIKAVQKNLDDAKAELNEAIASGDTELDGKIAALNKALDDAKAALEATDAANKAELVAKIDTADATLDKAIKAVQKNLDDAKAELNEAIASGDTELDGKITALNKALDDAKAALEATDAANKAELVAKIDTADATLDKAIKAVQKNLDDTKAELEAKDSALQTFIIIVCVVSGVSLCGSGAFVVWFFVDRKKKASIQTN
ncbi:MAG: hypothetical protein J6V80_04460 [Clostridia bacterium]|nr:hypothetical protein [Clostridia bacterium]